MLRATLAVVLLATATLAAAQPSLEVISLRHRTADQVLDTLRPLVEPGGTLTGQGSRLIVRVSPDNLAEIRRALDAIDRPLRRLRISVRFDDAFDSSRRDLEASGSISNRGVRIEGSAGELRRSTDSRVDQSVQALEGGRATIFTGQSRPVRQRQYIQTPTGVVSQELTVVQEATSGFEVIPRLSGNLVTVEIYTSRAGSTTASSIASGPLGEWFELGAIERSADREARGMGSLSESRATGSCRVSVKVDALD